MIICNEKNKLEYKKKILSGIILATDAIISTFGPNGQLVAIVKNDNYSQTRFTKDGATVAKNISSLKDTYANIGADLVKHLSVKMANEIGDGSTTVVLLFRAFIEKSMQLMEIGTKPKQIHDALNIIAREMKQYIAQVAIIIDEKSPYLKQIAELSAHNKEDSKIIPEIYEIIGKKGTIVIEESKNNETTWLHKKGFSFDNGPASQAFLKDKTSITVDDAHILITSKKMSNIIGYTNIFQNIIKAGKNLIIVADDFDSEFLKAVLINNLRGLNCICIKAPGFGDNKANTLEDLALMSGATLIGDSDIVSEAIELRHLGKFNTVHIYKDFCSFIGYNSKYQILIDERISYLEQLVYDQKTEYEQEKTRTRIGRLTNGTAVILVGGHTESEIKEKKDRIEDAVHACRNALQKGIVIGGGMEFMRCYQQIIQNYPNNTILHMLSECLLSVVRTLIAQDGNSIDIFYHQLIQTNGNMGYTNSQIQDLLNCGIVTPATVPIRAIELAASTCKQFCSMESILIEEQDKSDKIDY